MKTTLEAFAKMHGLSQRETQVLELLVEEVSSLKDMAQQLRLSPHTVNNHFKSIFDKTGTNSRTEVMRAFLKYMLGEGSPDLNTSVTRGTAALFYRPLKVMVVDDEPELVKIVSNGLRRRGMIAYEFTDG